MTTPPLRPDDVPDFETRVRQMRSRARWSTGHTNWADVLLAAFLDPEADEAHLTQELRKA